MSRHWDIKLDKYEIDKYAYRELLNFCRQYPIKKDKLKDLRAISAVQISGMPKGGSVGTPTEKKALRCEQLSADCELIESTAIEAGGDVYTWLLTCVTVDGKTWNELQPPMGRNQFYERRRKFFYLLAYKRGML